MSFSRKLAVFSIFTCFTALAHADFQERLIAKFPTAEGAKIEKAFPGFWSVVKNNEVLYFNEDLTMMINGDVINLTNNQSLTEKLKEANSPKIDVSKLPLGDAIKLGEGMRRIFIFSDPDCPYCKRLEIALNQLKNTQIFIFPLPLTELHSNARVVSESIWCQSNPKQAWKSYMDSGITPVATTCDNPISRNLILAKKLHIMGTPAIIFEDGSIVPGAIAVERINEKLNSLSKK